MTTHRTVRCPITAWNPPGIAVAGAAVVVLVLLTGCGRSADEAAAPATTSRSVASPQASGASGSAMSPVDAPFPDIALHLREIRRVGNGQGGGANDEREAVIEVASQRGSFRAGQEVFPGVTVEAIDADQVHLRFRTRSRTLQLLDGRPGAANGIARPFSLAAATAPVPAAADDLREQNRKIEIARLTTRRPMAADAFLREVRIAADPRGGFVVDEVLPDSRYEQLGLRRGDVIHSLDTPEAAAVDESSMVSLMQQHELVLHVQRNGLPVTLRLALNRDPAEPAAQR